MKEVLVVAGYGDATWYVSALKPWWKLRYGLNIHPFPFGTTETADQYPRLWRNWEQALNQLGNVAIIGISFGFSIAARSKIEYPDRVGKIVGISCPHDILDMDKETVNKKYPMLKASLGAFDMADLPADDVMTIRPERDEVIKPERVVIDGARNIQTSGSSHAGGIASALLHQAPAIVQFIKEGHI